MEIEKQVEDIKEQIIKKYKPEKIIVFGSYARGELNCDFLVYRPEEFEERIRLGDPREDKRVR